MEDTRALFELLDRDGDGSISRHEFHKALTGKRKKQLREMLGADGQSWTMVLQRIDTDHNGSVGFQEFTAAVAAAAKAVMTVVTLCDGTVT